jgi:hypothetical protein
MIALVAVILVLALWWFSRQSELFCVSVRNGKVLVVRGRVPAALLGDVKDVVSKPAVSSATIRAVKHEEAARLQVSGYIDEGRAQRLRNCFRLYPISRLRAAPVIEKPTLGQLLGVAWLAWFLDGTLRR